MLQVSSGLLRGIPLCSPSGKQTRPTSERIRQAIFNVLRHYRWSEESSILVGATVVDLFAGTGAWGIEALSNGASEAWFLESHALALRALEENLTTAMRCFEAQDLVMPTIHLLRRDALEDYRQLPETRLIFCDPPYDKGFFEKTLQLEFQCPRLVEGGLLIYESGVKEVVPSPTGMLRQFDKKIYGDSAVHFFVKQTTNDPKSNLSR